MSSLQDSFVIIGKKPLRLLTFSGVSSDELASLGEMSGWVGQKGPEIPTIAAAANETTAAVAPMAHLAA
jgi:hypothetical protein